MAIVVMVLFALLVSIMIFIIHYINKGKDDEPVSTGMLLLILLEVLIYLTLITLLLLSPFPDVSELIKSHY